MKRLFFTMSVFFLFGGFILAQQGRGTLVIQSDQSDAKVLINGRLYGTTSPNLTLVLPVGIYRLNITKAGFPPFSQTITLNSSGLTVPVFFNKLGPGNTPGPGIPVFQAVPIIVNSNVPGSEVLIDGNAVGRTPYTGTIMPGPHIVIVRGGGYKDFIQTIQATNTGVQINAFLEGQNSQLTIQSNIPNSEVLINGNPSGRTPLSLALPPGVYAVIVRSIGYADFTQTVLLSNQPVLISAILQVVSYPLSIDTPSVRSAQVIINGRSVGQTPYTTSLPTGSYNILLRAQGYNDYQTQINVNGPQTVAAIMVPILGTWQFRIPENFLKGDLRPGQRSAFIVFLDEVPQFDWSQGQGRGQSSPGSITIMDGQVVASGQLAPGRHRVRFVAGPISAGVEFEALPGRNYVFEPFAGINVK